MAFIKRHPALTYFVLTFTISWGGILLVIGPTGLVPTRAEFDKLFPIAVLVMVLGPSLTGIVLTGLVDGRSGLRAFRSRLLRWRVSARWYAVALVAAPLYFMAVLLALSPLSSELLPGILASHEKVKLLLLGLATAVAAGFFEELGWTGFAVPTLQRRYGVFATGLVVGVLWAAWHFLVKIWGANAFGMTSVLPADLLSAVVQLTGFRILMVWVYDRTESLLLAMLMHASLTASTVILAPLATGATLVSANLVLAAVPWVIIAVVAVARRRSSTPRHSSVASAHS